MRTGVCMVLALMGVLLSATCASGAVGFSDGTFSDSDWTLAYSSTRGPGGRIVSAGQASEPGAGGGHDVFRRTTTQVYDAQYGQDLPIIQGFYFRPDWVYDPAVYGAIDTISCSLDVRSLGVGMGLAIKQGDCIYAGGGYFIEYRGFWASTPNVQYPPASGFTGLRASDFAMYRALSGTPRPNPDFSICAPPITFGYITANSTDFAHPGYIESADIDNLSITVTPRSLGISNRALSDPVMAVVPANWTFKVWGEVKSVDDTTIVLDDASGKPVTMTAPGHPALAVGNYAAAAGYVTYLPSGATLACEGSQVLRLQ
jgi:hypothetical protein